MTWEGNARNIAQESLEDGFLLFDFKVVHLGKSVKIKIDLDKETNPHGSPSVRDCIRFSKSYSRKLEDFCNTTDCSPKEYSLEVSSPGAYRQIKIPSDLERFRSYPMKVQYLNDDKTYIDVFNFLEIKDKLTQWKLAQIDFNKKQGKLKKQKGKHVFDIMLSQIEKVSLFPEIK